MGNTSSFSPSSIKVIDTDGRLQEFSRSLSASELMRKNPGQFVCDSNNLSVGCRIPGLAGGDELQPHRLYFLLPMDLLYSVLTDEEMASLTIFKSSSLTTKRRYRNIRRRIFPVLSELCLIPCEANKVVVVEKEKAESRWGFDACSSDGDGDVKISKQQRWWRPALDTIEEDPCLL